VVFLLGRAFVAVNYRVQLSSRKVELGYVKVSDDNLIVVCVAIVNVRPAGKMGLL
jgi:hypothetical protein